MKRVPMVVSAVLGMIAASQPVVAGSGSFGGGSTAASSMGSSAAHGSTRSASSISARSAGSGSGLASRRSAATSSGGSQTSSHFSPLSVVPVGYAAPFRGFNGPAFAGRSATNPRRPDFSFGRHNHFHGRGWFYFGPGYDDNYADSNEAYRRERDRVADDPAPVAPAAVAAVAALVPPPALPPVGLEYAYGSIVTEVQTRLTNDGYFRGSIDGFITSGTRTAIALFQDNHQLIITGRIDAALLRALALKP